MIGRAASYYKIIEHLDGGIGVVSGVKDLKLGLAVALKFPSPELMRDPGIT